MINCVIAERKYRLTIRKDNVSSNYWNMDAIDGVNDRPMAIATVSAECSPCSSVYVCRG